LEAWCALVHYGRFVAWLTVANYSLIGTSCCDLIATFMCCDARLLCSGDDGDAPMTSAAPATSASASTPVTVTSEDGLGELSSLQLEALAIVKCVLLVLWLELLCFPL
jgi:hypothetical protein